MAKKRDFYTGSTNIIGDPRPSGLDMRVYACVSMHDGMSLRKGTGGGCYATFATLTAEIGCDASNLSKSLRRLVEWGYLVEERQEDRRRRTYRVVFDHAESWRNGQQSFVGETANEAAEIVGNGESGNGGNPPQTEQHYSSLKELNTPEGEKLDSSEEAHLAARGLSKIEFADNPGAQLARFERHWKARPESFDQETLDQWCEFFEWVMEAYKCGAPEYGQAERISDELAERIDGIRSGHVLPQSAATAA